MARDVQENLTSQSKRASDNKSPIKIRVMSYPCLHNVFTQLLTIERPRTILIILKLSITYVQIIFFQKEMLIC